LHLGYGPTLDPQNIEWMLRDDWAAYLWGFLFFRNADWTLPLGVTPDLLWPHGTTVAFTDANPVVSVFFRALSPILPPDFQFAGLWFLACFVLQAYFGTRITALFTGDRVRQALGGMLFAATPILPHRHAHVALCALFFVTAALYLNLAAAPSRRAAKRAVLAALALLAWSGGTHGYLSVMVLALAFALFAKLALIDRSLRGREALAAAVLAVLVTLLTYALFGYIGYREMAMGAEGFGQFSGDLAALFNPMGWSRFRDALPARPRQYEGFAYLGLGALVLLALRALLWALSPRRAWRGARRLAPLFVMLAAMWFYAWSSRVTYLGEEVANLDALYAHLGTLPSIFRSSGRFAWPLHLALLAAAVSAGAALEWRPLGRALMLFAVLLQAAELDPEKLDFEPRALHRLEDPAWASLGEDYAHLALHPLQLKWVCRYEDPLVNRLSYEAYRQRVTFNSGNIMRSPEGMRALCEQHLTAASFDEATVYVVRGGFQSDFRRLDATCGRLEGLVVCVSNRRATPLLEALSKRRL
jgi:hypothetical protein